MIPLVVIFTILSILMLIESLILCIITFIRAKKNPQNLYLGFYFLFVVLTLLVNAAAISIGLNFLDVYKLMMKISTAFGFVSIAFILLFLINIRIYLDPQIQKKFNAFFLALISTLSILFVIFGQMDIDLVNNNPIYDLGTSIFVLVFWLCYLIDLTYEFIQLYPNFKDPEVKSRFLSFFVGSYITVIMFGSILAANSQLISGEIAILAFGIGLIISGLLLFIGLTRKLEKRPK